MFIFVRRYIAFITRLNNLGLTLIKSISGVRGTIGGPVGENLSPIEIVNLTAALAELLKKRFTQPSVLVGRDGRITGPQIEQLVVNTLSMSGVNVLNAGLSTTPTIEMGVPMHNQNAGIIISASHNKMNWNALKILNDKGEFISGDDLNELLAIAEAQSYNFATHEALGSIRTFPKLIHEHIDKILQHPLVNAEAIASAKLYVIVDPINSTGAIAMKALLDALQVKTYFINEDMNGQFAHNPEPLAANLDQLKEAVINASANLGIAVDPDVDRLAFVSEDGSFFGEEYTLVAVADYVLSKTPGACVSNLSSTRALQDVAQRHNSTYFGAAVGEVNVVNKMKEVSAVIGGEGNGGVIDPTLHYGRDALIGAALFLTYMVDQDKPASAIRKALPNYFMSKNKVALTDNLDLASVLQQVEHQTEDATFDYTDGLKINFPDSWVHLRGSNTEPIIRIYTEAQSKMLADELGEKYVSLIEKLTE